MKPATAASLKRLNAENLRRLGTERLAELLIAVTASRPELKRRLRMELAAAQGPEHLAPEIDKRLTALETSAGKISWRVRPAFLRELDALRLLIADRMALLDQAAALERLWRFIGTARRVSDRVRGRDEELAAIYAKAAADVGGLIDNVLPAVAASDLARLIADNPHGWTNWLAALLQSAPARLAGDTLRALESEHEGAGRLIPIVRQLSDAAGDVDAFISTYSPNALMAPSSAAAVAGRLMKAGRIEDAGAMLRAAAPEATSAASTSQRAGAVEFDWETAWIDYLDRSGQGEAAQAVRWSSFQRTLSVDRLRDFTRRLKDFEDVEAEHRAFAYAASSAGFRTGLRFLMDWPALPEAAQMIEARALEVTTTIEEAELWAAKLRRRQPRAAQILLRKAAAAAFKRREYKTADRLTQDADAVEHEIAGPASGTSQT